MEITLEQLNDAFNKAESETAEQFASKTCSLEDKDGNHTCPICYFRKRVREHLGFVEENKTSATAEAMEQ